MYRTVRIIILSILLTLLSNLNAQVTQIGKVVELNSNGKILQGVGITVYSANDVQPAVSDANGIFILKFSEKKAGDMLYGFRVSKHGYEIVNNKIYKTGWVLTEKDTLKIVLAPIGKLSQARAKYYNIIDNYQITHYQTTINNLNKELEARRISAEEYRRQADEAEDALHEAYNLLELYADRFARINKDDMDSISRLAFDAIDRGKVETAIKIYEERNLLDKLKSNIALRNESVGSINTLISLLKQEIQIRLLAFGEKNIQKIDKIWEQILLSDTTNIKNISEYESFIKEYYSNRKDSDSLNKSLDKDKIIKN